MTNGTDRGPGGGQTSRPVAHYDAHYAHFASSVVTEVRREAFGEDIGQNSWLTTDEYRRFIGWLELSPASHVLDVGSGSGGPALFLAQEAGCRVTGIDLNEHGVANANRLALDRSLQGRARFQKGDASQPLAFADGTFDAVACIDSINHLPGRPRVIAEWTRVLRPAGRLLFTDPITVTGILTSEEIAIRSSIGYFLYTPAGIDERIIESAGLEVLRRDDVTENMATVARRWHDARERRRESLLQLEGTETFEGQQKFFLVAHRLAAEGRLSRFAFLARRP